MTVYNGMFRCEGGQKKPVCIEHYPRGKPIGECSECKGFFRLYPNGMVVMHKRRRLRTPKSNPRIR